MEAPRWRATFFALRFVLRRFGLAALCGRGGWPLAPERRFIAFPQAQEKHGTGFRPVGWKWRVIRAIELLRDVRFGSKADIDPLTLHVRFTPKS